MCFTTKNVCKLLLSTEISPFEIERYIYNARRQRVKEEISDFQIKSGEINFWRKLTRLRQKMWGKLTFLEKIRKKVNFLRDNFLENPEFFSACGGPIYLVNSSFWKLKTPFFFACGGLSPLKNTFLLRVSISSIKIFRLRRANLPCKFIIWKLKTPTFFACGELLPCKSIKFVKFVNLTNLTNFTNLRQIWGEINFLWGN